VIRVKCCTDLDTYNGRTWFTKLFIEPKIGHKIMTPTGIEVYIVEICHCTAYVKLKLSKEMLTYSGKVSSAKYVIK